MNNKDKPFTFAARLNQALSITGIKQIELSRLTGIYKGTINNYLLGKYEPKQDKLEKIAEALNVSPVWLMGYDVPKERENKTPEKLQLTEGEEKWLMLYNKLSSESRNTLVEIAEAFEKMPKETKQFLLAGIRANFDSQK